MTTETYDKKPGLPPLPKGVVLDEPSSLPPLPKGVKLDVEKKSKVVGSSPLQSSGEDFPLLYERDKKQMAANIRDDDGMKPLSLTQEQSNQANRLQAGFAEVTSPVVNKPIAETIRQVVPREIKDGIKKDKTVDTGTVGYIFNSIVDATADLVSSLPEATNAVLDAGYDLIDRVSGTPGLTKSISKQGGGYPFLRAPEGQDIREGIRNVFGVSTTYQPNFDVTNGVQASDIKALATQAPRQLFDLVAAAYTRGGSFLAQSISQNAEELSKNPEAEKLSSGERLGYIFVQASTQAALEKIGFNKMLKATGVSKKLQQQVANKVTQGFIDRGVKATAADIEKAILKEVSALPNQLKRLGAKGLVGGGAESITEGTQTLSSAGGKVLMNRIKGKEIFNEESITTNLLKDVINSSVQGKVFGTVGSVGVGMMQNTNKALRAQIAKAQSPADIEKIRTDIAEQVELGNITQEEADAANITADQYAKVAAKIPSDVDAEQKYAIIGGIEQREGIKKEIEKIKKGNENLDPAFHESSRATLELLEAKLEQTNDYLEGVIAGKKPTYRKEKPTTEGGEEKYYKTSPSGEETKITKEHYDLATAVREEQAAKNKEGKEVKGDILETLKSKAGEFEKGENLQYFTDKAGEAPAQYYEKYGKEITDKLLENVPTEKLKQNLDDLLNIDAGNPNVPILDKLIAQREESSSTPMQEGAEGDVVTSALKDEDYSISRLDTKGEENVFVAEDKDGNEIGRATLSKDGNYLENIRIDEKYRRKGIASKMYDFIELNAGVELQPSPVKQSVEAKKFWEKRNLQKSVSKKANGGLLAKALNDAIRQTFGEQQTSPTNEAKTGSGGVGGGAGTELKVQSGKVEDILGLSGEDADALSIIHNADLTPTEKQILWRQYKRGVMNLNDVKNYSGIIDLEKLNSEDIGKWARAALEKQKSKGGKFNAEDIDFEELPTEQSLKEAPKAETTQNEKVAELEAARDMEVGETQREQNKRIREEVLDLLGDKYNETKDEAGNLIAGGKRAGIKVQELRTINEALKKLLNCI